ncbi:MAG: hypothetical protein RID09_03850 [Coleofasciculus sp. G1-WW12-02]|uniref:hypothetical protein n=1 Tax=Coleofasciculus sp. G1-WW12-02 TaxID=3068483 RepID=UPI003304F127
MNLIEKLIKLLATGVEQLFSGFWCTLVMMTTYKYSASALNQDHPYKGQGAGTFGWLISLTAAVEGEFDADKSLKSIPEYWKFLSRCGDAERSAIT